MEINTEDVKLVKTNISSLHSKRHLQSIFFIYIKPDKILKAVLKSMVAMTIIYMIIKR